MLVPSFAFRRSEICRFESLAVTEVMPVRFRPAKAMRSGGNSFELRTSGWPALPTGSMRMEKGTVPPGVERTKSALGGLPATRMKVAVVWSGLAEKPVTVEFCPGFAASTVVGLRLRPSRVIRVVEPAATASGPTAVMTVVSAALGLPGDSQGVAELAIGGWLAGGGATATIPLRLQNRACG